MAITQFSLKILVAVHACCIVALAGNVVERAPPTAQLRVGKRRSAIPHRLWFTYMSNFVETNNPAELPLRINDTVAAYKEAWRDELAQANFLDDDQCAKDVAAAEPLLLHYYRQEKSIAKRTDVCRVSVLYLHGGYFFDMDDDLEVVEAFVPKTESLSFVTVSSGGDAFLNFFIASAPKQPVLRQTLMQILTAYKTETDSVMLGSETLTQAYFSLPERSRREAHLLGAKELRQDDFTDLVRQKGWDQCTAIIHDVEQSKVHFFSSFVANENCQPTTIPHRMLSEKPMDDDKINEAGADESSGMVVVVANQPKCGTGTILNSVYRSLQCVDYGHVQTHVKRYDCRGQSTVFQTHDMKKGAAKSLDDLRLGRSSLFFDHFGNDDRKPFHPEQKVIAGKCLVVTAVRNPLKLLPSWFAEQYKEQLNHEDLGAKKVETEYSSFLKSLPHRRLELYDATFDLLQAFGATNMTEELERQEAEGGHSYLERPDPDGPWRGCKLLFLRLEAVDTWAETFSSAIHSPVELHSSSTLGKYPDAAKNVESIKNPQEFAKEVAAISTARPIFGEVLNYYESSTAASKQRR